MQISANVQGLSELESALRSLGAEMGAKTLRSALRDAAKPIEDYMLANAPVGSIERQVKTRTGKAVRITPGFLRSKIKRRTRLNKRGVAGRHFNADEVAMVRVGVFRLPYVVHVEYGTSKARAQPFIRPALFATQDEVLSLVRERLHHRIKLAARRLAKSRAR